MIKIFKEWKWTVIFGLLLLIFGVLIRLYRLTLLPIFVDEAIYVRWAQVMGAEPTLRFLPLSDGKQPLFMWILMFYVRHLSDPLFAGRLLSIASGVGTMAGIFALTYFLFRSKLVSLAASSIWAISPYAFFFDRMALVDSMLTMFGVWTAFFGLAAAKTKRLDMAILTGFTLGFASLTKSPAIFFALLLPLSWMLYFPKEKRVKYIFTAVGLLGVSYIAATAMYNVQRLGPNFEQLTARTGDYVFPLSRLWTNPKDPFIFLIDRTFEWIRMLGPWPILILVVFGVFAMSEKHKKEGIFLLAWWLIPTLIQSEFAKVFTARYELFTLPYLFIVAASGFMVKTKKLKVLFAVCCLLFALLAFRFDYLLMTNVEAAELPRSERSGYLEEWTAGTGINETADYIKNLAKEKPEEAIVVGTEGYFGTLPDGLQIYLNDQKNVIVIGVGVEFAQVPEQLTGSIKAGTKTYFVANSSRLHFEKSFEELGLKVVAQYKKADRPEGTKSYIQHGPYDYLYLFEVFQ